MIKFLRILAALVVLGVIALLAFLFVPVQLTKPTAELAADWKPAEGQGKAALYAGDCVACHTAPGGQTLAGGHAIDSDMGKIWSTNITPDKETGIGNWTLDQFRAAMVDGIAPGGVHLYPAMPYENFRFLTEEDIRALYAYLMDEVQPVSNVVPKTELSFPFNMRFGIRAWNWLALDKGAGFTPAGTSAEQDRGQYLVEGAGHCAACHSPRTTFMAQDGVKASEPSFLSGGSLGAWSVPALRGPNSAIKDWSVQELATYLATGRNNHAVANGEMALVVQDSLQHLSDADVIAMAAFLKGLDGGAVGELPQLAAPVGPIATPQAQADDKGAQTAALLTEASPDLPLGARLYLDNCSGCHFVTGKGAAGIFPALQGASIVNGANAAPLISVILNGTSVKGTASRPMHLVMQGYAHRLSDADVAELATFLRSAWGNTGGAVTAESVAKLR